jgi:hypothetical protein
MNEDELMTLYKQLKQGFEYSNWEDVECAIDYIAEFLEIDDEGIDEQ